MLSPECLGELRSAWLPNISDSGLDRIIELLEKSSPLLVHGCFTRTVPMGCLATHVAWHHPRTRHLTLDAGINWLHHVAGLNPATSHVLHEWDRRGIRDLELRAELLEVFHKERHVRQSPKSATRKTPSLSRV
ncbi:MAG TPA: hypothetical protein VN688_34310 [Gemmataceae bacterium]|nr:hypothetical protein [Gemmataceae bacterium]